MSSHVLRPAVERFLADAGARLAARGTESPEALLSSPLRDLVVSTSQALLSRQLDLGDQATEPGIGRPDFALKDDRLVLGHVELKQLGKGARPTRFRDKHDKQQWKRFQLLPNLLYTDGSEFLLIRDGQEIAADGNRTALVTIPLHASTSARRVDDAALDDLQRLLIDFFAWSPSPPSSLSDLARKIAPLCGVLRDAVRDALDKPGSQVAALTNDLRLTLFNDANDDDLADAFAQTCTYSMLLASSDGAGTLDVASVEATLRKAHPLLADVVRHLLHPKSEQEIAWTISLLRRQIEVVDFARLSGTKGRDTWLYFYEDFLAQYDIRLRNNRGAYYTPAEVISAQVALADDVLRTRLGKADGFGDPAVHVIDPAVGTGSYPLAIVNAAAAAHASFGPGMTAPAATSVIDRIHAFEILVGPYAVAKMRLAELVRDLGGDLPRDGLHVYLVDALAPPDQDTSLLGSMSLLTEEQDRARRFKTEQSIVVCIGNPPYDREQRDVDDLDARRKGAWVRFGNPGRTDDRPLLADYIDPVRHAGQGTHLKNLYNDYVYFWRWASWKAFEAHPKDTRASGGIVSYITAASWLGGPAFSGMRAHLRSMCDDMYVIDLGGEGRGARTSENVFDIQTPVAITMCIRDPGTKRNRLATVHYADWSDGTRAEKLARLAAVDKLDDIEWTTLDLPSIDAKIVPGGAGSWDTWPTIERLLPWRNTGVQLKRTWPIAPTDRVLRDRWDELVHAPETQRAAWFVPTRDRSIAWKGKVNSRRISTPASLGLLEAGTPSQRRDAAQRPEIAPYQLRTLDEERVFVDGRLGDYLKPVLWDLHGPTQAYLCTLTGTPIGAGVAGTVVGVSPPDLHVYRGSFGGADNFPLWRDVDGTVPNVTPGLLDAISTGLGRAVDGPTLFCYVAGVLGTPAYSSRYDEQLKRPNPRIPLATTIDDFFAIADRGRRIAYLHARGARFGLPSETLPRGRAQLTTAVEATSTPATMSFDAAAGELVIGSGVVTGVTPEVWEFEASGFKVVQEWVRRRLAPVPGKARSELDAIRPIVWDAAMQRALLRTLWIVEELVEEHQPAMAALLKRVEGSGTWNADDLPTPSEESTKAPKV